MTSIDNQKIIRNLKILALEMAWKKKEGHLGSSYSILDLLYIIYNQHLTQNLENPDSELVLSKGHASLGLYVVLYHFNLISKKDLNDFVAFDGSLGGHPSRNKIKHVGASTGSLGHGLPFALGQALADRMKGANSAIFCVIGDGELNEGTIWESFLLIAHHNLNRLITIIDNNSSGERALRLGSLEQKMNSFGFKTITIDGHNHDEIGEALKKAKSYHAKPTVIIANTIKGNGVKRMENNPAWHHKFPNDEEFSDIVDELRLL